MPIFLKVSKFTKKRNYINKLKFVAIQTFLKSVDKNEVSQYSGNPASSNTL